VGRWWRNRPRSARLQNARVCLPAHGRASQAPGLGPTR
jgi:hypothetical protein